MRRRSRQIRLELKPNMMTFEIIYELCFIKRIKMSNISLFEIIVFLL